MELAKQAQGTIWVEDISDLNQIFDWNRSYKKAGCVLHMLRGIAGDSTYFEIMRAYSSDPELKWGTAETEDFQRVAENVYGQDLDYFFQEWIYGENYPKYTVGWSKYPVGGDIYHITLNIFQTANANPIFFTMPVQVKFNTLLGDTIITLFNNALAQTYQLNINGLPTSVEFDPGNWILKSLLRLTEAEDVNLQPVYGLEQNYPNPFNPATRIQYTISSRQFVSLKVYGVLGNLIETLINEEIPAGTYEITWNAASGGSQLPSGVYFYQLKTGDFIQTKKMILLR
jgi:aminopeptidase N